MRPSVDREVDEEFSHHVEMHVRDLVGQGWTEDDARREAMRRFGDIDRLKADCRELGTRRDAEMGRRLWWDELRQDIRYALRQLRRAPLFAAVAVATLGIAIGSNTAVFSVVNAVLLEPLPFPESDRLTAIWTRYLPPSGFDIDKFPLSGPEILDLAESTRTLASVGIYRTTTQALTGDDAAAERISVGLYSASLLPTLGVAPLLGRGFTSEEDVADGPAVALLSHSVWTRRYGADPTIVGRSVLMNGLATEVIGVMPENFEFPTGTVAWLPLGLDRTNEGGRASHGYSAVGRLAPGMTREDLAAELDVHRQRWSDEFEHNVAHFAWAQSLHAEVVGDAPRRLTLLMVAVALVLLVACANIANLLLARAERRQSEVALRRTLGAGRARITRQLATESLVLASLAAVAGVVLARLGLSTLIAIDPTALPRLAEVRLDGTVLLFTLGVSAFTALLFGILPAHLAGRRASEGLASSAGRAVGSRGRSSLRRTLVAGEVAGSLTVVILAGLVVRSFGALSGTDPRMDPENLLSFSISLPESAYPDDARIPEELGRVIERIRAIPGVTAASMATNLPFTGTGQWDFELDDRPQRQEGEVAWNAGITHVGPRYFETMGIPVLDGRSITSEDRRDSEPVAVVSEAMANRYWPGERVVGKRFGYPRSDGPVVWIDIVGLVPDPVTLTLDREPYPHVYVPHAQADVATYFMPRTMQIAVRTGPDQGGVLPAVRATMVEFDADLPLYRVTLMEDVVRRSFAGPRVTTNLLGLFAIIALILASVGIYGVVSYTVAGRTREIGVRVALGAERSRITRLILAEGARPVVAGVALGLVGAWLSTRLVEAMLYGIEPTDPLTYSSLALLLLAIGLLASLLPALRATRIAPTEALRYE